MTEPTVYAAGGVVWRFDDGKLRVLVVQRPRYRDITLPKGKLEHGESLPETAVREIREETGIQVDLGAPIGVSTYRLPNDRTKVVHYWAAEATDAAVRASSFSPNKEIDAIEWMGVKKARKQLSYPVDIEILDAFVSLVDRGALHTFPVIALRHAKAKSRDAWDGEDAARPLAPRGRRQADAIVGTLRAFGPRRIVSSPAERCVQTVTPLSGALARRVELTDRISQNAWEEGAADVPGVIDERLRARKPVVLCSHGPVLPDILAELTRAAGTVPGAFLGSSSSLEPGAFSVVHLTAEGDGTNIVAIETHNPRV